MKTRFPPQKLLVAFDGSQPSWSALEAAKKTALRLGCHLDVIYVEEVVARPVFEGDGESAAYRNRSAIDAGVIDALGSLPAHLWSFRVIKGQAEGELVRRASPRHAELVVMGTHARKGSERFLMGSTAEVVFHRARIPVLTLRAGQTLDCARILVPCHFERYADEALLYAVAWAGAFDGKITALHVPPGSVWDVDADEALKKHLTKVLGACAAGGIERVIRQGDPRVEIVKEAQSGRYGLVVVSGHRRAQLSDLALGTTAERLLRECAAPLLVVPAGVGSPNAQPRVSRRRGGL